MDVPVLSTFLSQISLLLQYEIMKKILLILKIQWELKSDHLKSGLLEGQISNDPFSNCRALAMAVVPTIRKLDIFVRISNGFQQNGGPLSGFQMVGLLDFRSHSKSRPLLDHSKFGWISDPHFSVYKK